jgi:hypothetical protein
MSRWYVLTPPMSLVAEWIDGWPRYETERDLEIVDAPTAQAAKVEAVRRMRTRHSEWTDDARSDNASPFTGLKAERMSLCTGCGLFEDECRCIDNPEAPE